MSRPRQGWLLEQLPSALSEPTKPTDPAVRYLEMADFMRIFEYIANSVEDEIDAIDRYFDPALAPLEFVRWMGRWLGVDISPTMRPDQQIRLLEAAGRGLTWRGTATGLRLMIEAFTGSEVEVADSGGVFQPGDELPERRRVEVRMASGGDIAMDQLFALIRDEIPADAALTLDVGGRVKEESELPVDGEQEDST